MGFVFCILGILLLIGVLILQEYRSGFFRKLLFWLMVTLGLLAVLIGIALFLVLSAKPEIGVGLTSVPWLDSRATEVSFYRANDTTGNLAYEFRIGQADFDAVAKARGWVMAKSTSLGNLPRYTFFVPTNHPLHRPPFFAEIENGYAYNLRQNNGGGITVFYAPAASMAYVHESSR